MYVHCRVSLCAHSHFFCSALLSSSFIIIICSPFRYVVSVHCSTISWLFLCVLFSFFFSHSPRRSNWWQRFGDALSTKGTHNTHCTCKSRFMLKQFSIYCFSMKFSELQREKKKAHKTSLLITVHIDTDNNNVTQEPHMLCSITSPKHKCEKVRVFMREREKK